MPGKDWRAILSAIEGLPSGLPSEHVAAMAHWFQVQIGEIPLGEGSEPSRPAREFTADLERLSFIAVRERMERLGMERQLRAQERALLCAWVWSLAGSKDFCSNDAQKLFGEDGSSLNAHHFNQQAVREIDASSLDAALLRIGKGRYRLTDRGREEGRRLAEQYLFAPGPESATDGDQALP